MLYHPPVAPARGDNPRQPPSGVEPSAIEGTVERVTFYNPQNGFSVIKLRVRGRRVPVAVVGSLPAVQPGETLALSGSWRTDPRHGAQFEPRSAEVRRPSDVEGIVRYLGSGLIHQVGPVLAQRIVKTFGERTLEVLDSAPARVREVPGIGRQRAEAVAAAWHQHRALRGVMAFLAEHQIDTRFAPRLVSVYGTEAPQVLRTNPYRLVAEIPRFGFAAADRLGRALGVRETAPARLQGAVHAALLRAAEQGHTRLSREALRTAIGSLELGIEEPQLRPLLEAALAQLLASGTVCEENGTEPEERAEGRGQRAEASEAPAAMQSAEAGAAVPDATGSEAGTPMNGGAPTGGRLRIYEPNRQPGALPAGAPSPTSTLGLVGLVRAEEELAARLLRLVRHPGLPAGRVEAWLAADAEARRLSPEQQVAVRTAATSGCFVLTGGPGVGKTTTLRVLVRCLQALGRSVALAAPTGKAAKRLAQVVELEAKTLHRLLGAGPSGFRYGAREPLPFDVVIVDETSMLDTQLARALVRAVGPRSQLVFVGDADQLPSVGPGQVLRDLLASGQLPAARLQRVFRQAARSRIVTNAHRIRQGLLPELAPPSALAEGIDCVFVPAHANQIVQVAAEWAARKLPQALGLGPADVQVLAPLTRVCQSLNSLLQARLNPPRGQAERPHGALPLRVGDRVIQTRNNYLLGVFNGDSGTLVDVQPDSVSIDFGDGRTIGYAAADLLDLDHAYCLTVHRSQGSEWPGVVVLASSSYGPMLSRNLLYTALTRARQAVVIVGDEAAIARAVNETRDQERSTGLARLLTTDDQPASGGTSDQPTGAPVGSASAEADAV